jgi:hypothetical protein
VDLKNLGRRERLLAPSPFQGLLDEGLVLGSDHDHLNESAEIAPVAARRVDVGDAEGLLVTHRVDPRLQGRLHRFLQRRPDLGLGSDDQSVYVAPGSRLFACRDEGYAGHGDQKGRLLTHIRFALSGSSFRLPRKIPNSRRRGPATAEADGIPSG